MLLSIIIPNYNYEKFIISTLISIENQDYENLEVVIVDDGSTDNSVHIIEDFISKSKLNVVLVKTQNSGQASAINRGISISSGEIIGWINSDDTFCPNTLGGVMKIFSQNNNIDIVYGDINVVDYSHRYLYTHKHRKFSYFFCVFNGFANNLSSNAFFWRKARFNDHNVLNVSFKCGLDNELFSRLTFNSVICHLKIPVANFRIQPYSIASLSSRDWSEQMRLERLSVFYSSYLNLKVSKFVSSSIALKFIPFFTFWRRVEKLFSNYYLRIIYNFFKNRINGDKNSD